MSKKTLTVWLPVDPEGDRTRLRERVRSHGDTLSYFITSSEANLKRQGYRFNPKQIARVKAQIREHLVLWDELVAGTRLEHIGAPQGKVAPAGANEHLSQTGKCLVTGDEEEWPGESQSRQGTPTVRDTQAAADGRPVSFVNTDASAVQLLAAITSTRDRRAAGRTCHDDYNHRETSWISINRLALKCFPPQRIARIG